MAGISSSDDMLDTPEAEVINPPQPVHDPAPNASNPNQLTTSSVRDLLQCPVCYNTMYAPIHQCPNGHTLCHDCKSRVHNRCPICRHEVGNIRCLALEKMAESLELHCKYQSYGCMGIYLYHSKLKHESQCVFRPYNCPCANSECTVIGDIPFLVAHLKDGHKVDMHNGSTFKHLYIQSNPHEGEYATWKPTVFEGRNTWSITKVEENAMWGLTLFNCDGQFFCLHFEAFLLEKSPVYIAFLRFMGDDDEAKNYRYILEVGGNGRKMSWQGVPRSIRESHRKVRDSLDGFVIQRNIALSFSRGDGKVLRLPLIGKIWKEQ